MEIKELSKARFDALTHSRDPLHHQIGIEEKFFSDDQEIIIGAIIFDLIDKNWASVILARDEKAIFRCIDVEVDIESIEDAEKHLLDRISYHVKNAKDIPEQSSKKNLIFKPVVSANKLNRYFNTLSSDIKFSPAKEIIQELAYIYEDLDGNYIQQFQTTGFNARLWELYLYAFLHESHCYISHDYSAPDYICTKYGVAFALEAVTVNPTQSSNPKIQLNPDENIEQKLLNYLPIKYGSALYSKLKKKYWELQHIKDKPLIIAIHDFHEDTLILNSSSALSTYLYGLLIKPQKDSNGKLTLIPEKIEKHVWADKEIESGFFYLPQTENISAVLFSNSATINKFNRMGKLAGFGDHKVQLVRIGTCYNPDPNATEPNKFMVNVEDNEYKESWSQGLEMFHNPKALHPINFDLFPDIVHHNLEDGLIKSSIPEFHPIQSITSISIKT